MNSICDGLRGVGRNVDVDHASGLHEGAAHKNEFRGFVNFQLQKCICTVYVEQNQFCLLLSASICKHRIL
jgi:hypothetical protein